VLIYHRVRARPDPHRPADLDAATFQHQMRAVLAAGPIVGLAAGLRALDNRTLPAGAVAVTFDDGYLDNHDVALPILQDLGIVATFFVSTGFLEGECMWNDRVIEAMRAPRAAWLEADDLGLGTHNLGDPSRRCVAAMSVVAALKYVEPAERLQRIRALESRLGVAPARDLMMRAEHVRRLAESGMEIGAHTVSHPILARIDESAARREIAKSRELLAQIVERPIRFFAYPNGRPDTDYSRRDVEIVRSLGFEAAFSTEWGAAERGADRFQLPRFTPWDRSRVAFLARLAGNHFRRVRGAASTIIAETEPSA
jgi:peptidoglycan/xylan/chitin deacetylase (PgdA/CDA1 family)